MDPKKCESKPEFWAAEAAAAAVASAAAASAVSASVLCCALTVIHWLNNMIKLENTV